MSARGSKLSRAVQFFREGDVDEVRVAYTLVSEIVKSRITPTGKPKQSRGTRKPRLTNAQPSQQQAEGGQGS